MFESTENQFRKSFSIKSMRLVATENRFSGKSFPFGQNFTLLTWKSFYIVVLPSNDFRKKAQKRERAIERKNPCEQNTLNATERENDRCRSRSWSPELRRSASIAIDASHDRNLADLARSVDRDRYRRFVRSQSRRSRSRRSRSRSWSRFHWENVIFSGFYLYF